jgi:hypothetical protein
MALFLITSLSGSDSQQESKCVTPLRSAASPPIVASAPETLMFNQFQSFITAFPRSIA